jgi:hypothetical protein
LGFILGPSLLAVVSRSAVEGFEPLLLMALGWMLSVRGAHYGTFAGRRLGFGAILLSALATTGLAVLVYLAVHFVATRFGLGDAGLVALGLSAVTAEATLAAGAVSPPNDRRESTRIEWTTSTELPALIVLGMTVAGPDNLPFVVPFSATGVVLSLGLGVALGSVVTALLGAHFDEGELWPILLGSVLLVVGASLRLDLPAVTPAFLVGLTVATFSPHRVKIRKLVAATEPQLRLPCLLLAGAVLEWPKTGSEWLIVAVALGVRWGGRMLLGILVSVGRGLPSGSGIWLGRQMLRASSFSIAIGLAIFLRQSDELGRMVLMTAVLSAVIGELLAPRIRAEEPAALLEPTPHEEGSA